MGLPGGQPCLRSSLTHSTCPPSQAGSSAVAPSSSRTRSPGTGWQSSRSWSAARFGLGGGVRVRLRLGRARYARAQGDGVRPNLRRVVDQHALVEERLQRGSVAYRAEREEPFRRRPDVQGLLGPQLLAACALRGCRCAAAVGWRRCHHGAHTFVQRWHSWLDRLGC